ncbi:hypothetical protein QCD79_34625, partial [Pseudomonas quasicaspiana]|nr:hypothetical protein [Pseudomonas quasicaspiana]
MQSLLKFQFQKADNHFQISAHFMTDILHEMRRNLEVIVGFLELELKEALHKGQTPSSSVEVALV